MASTIAEGLVARGHDVTLFATVGSGTGGRSVEAAVKVASPGCVGG